MCDDAPAAPSAAPHPRSHTMPRNLIGILVVIILILVIINLL